MKDATIKVENQYDLIPGTQQQKIITKVVEWCKYHYYATENDLIDITIKSSGKIVKRCRYCERMKLENKQIAQKDWQKHKDNLTDWYVRTLLTKGKGFKLHRMEYPQELVEAKRASIKLKRAVDKQNRPMKKCVTHGALYKDDVIKAGKNRSGEQCYKCKMCMKELHKKHYELNKTKVSLKHKEYRENNRDKRRETKRLSRIRNDTPKQRQATRERWERWKEKNPERASILKREIKKAAVKNLNDSYIKQQLLRNTNLKSDEIPDILVDLKRTMMAIRRTIKRKNDGNKLLQLEELLNVQN